MFYFEVALAHVTTRLSHDELLVDCISSLLRGRFLTFLPQMLWIEDSVIIKTSHCGTSALRDTAPCLTSYRNAQERGDCCVCANICSPEPCHLFRELLWSARNAGAPYDASLRQNNY